MRLMVRFIQAKIFLFLAGYLVLIFTPRFGSGQSLNQLYKQTNINRITISNPDSVEIFRVMPVASSKKVNAEYDKYIFWYNNNKIQSTQGASAGKLLDGDYLLTDRNSVILRKGSFDKGLKNGTWRTWYPNGRLKTLENWKKSLRHNQFIEYYPDGNIKVRAHYRHNQLNGKLYRYNQEGKYIIEKYRNGELKVSEKKINKEPGILKGIGKFYQNIKGRIKKINFTKASPLS